MCSSEHMFNMVYACTSVVCIVVLTYFQCFNFCKKAKVIVARLSLRLIMLLQVIPRRLVFRLEVVHWILE
jgi:hypothetical protein